MIHVKPGLLPYVVIILLFIIPSTFVSMSSYDITTKSEAKISAASAVEQVAEDIRSNGDHMTANEPTYDDSGLFYVQQSDCQDHILVSAYDARDGKIILEIQVVKRKWERGEVNE